MFFRSNAIFSYFLSAIFFSKCEAIYKIWQQEITLGRPDLWDGGRVPCAGQVVILPEEVISVPPDFNFGLKTFLPENGMLLFPETGASKIFSFFDRFI